MMLVLKALDSLPITGTLGIASDLLLDTTLHTVAGTHLQSSTPQTHDGQQHNHSTKASTSILVPTAASQHDSTSRRPTIDHDPIATQTPKTRRERAQLLSFYVKQRQHKPKAQIYRFSDRIHFTCYKAYQAGERYRHTQRCRHERPKPESASCWRSPRRRRPATAAGRTASAVGTDYADHPDGQRDSLTEYRNVVRSEGEVPRWYHVATTGCSVGASRIGEASTGSDQDRSDCCTFARPCCSPATATTECTTTTSRSFGQF